MRALFVNPEKYASIVEQYEGLDEVQKHRKMCGIFNSPYKFRDAFDKSKYGPKYTMFYFDEDVKPTMVINYIKMLINLYGENDARYIVEYKLRNIDGNELIQVNTFNNFTDLKVSSELFNNILKESSKLFTCKSLL